MLEIVTGYSNCGGSTVALALLCNLFNDNGIPCQFYGPSDWVKCKLTHEVFNDINSCPISNSDTLIYHFLPINTRPVCKKIILSCHETSVFRIKDINPLADVIHFVSHKQKEWQDVEGVVIPNVLPSIDRVSRLSGPMVAGIIGSIDRHKRTHLSINRAMLNRDIARIELWGAISDQEYFNNEVSPLIKDKVIYKGVSTNMQEVYNGLHCVYHSSVSETFNYIEAECRLAGLDYFGLKESSSDQLCWDNQRILDAWKELIL